MTLHGSEYVCDWDGVKGASHFWRFVPVGGWNRVWVGIGDSAAEAWQAVTEKANEVSAA
jgi:hypothetical protein